MHLFIQCAHPPQSKARIFLKERSFERELQNPIVSQHMPTGIVKWFNEKKGFGFIVDPQFGEDIFVHFSEIRTEGFKTLQEGENVDFELFQDGKGAKARNVVRKS